MTDMQRVLNQLSLELMGVENALYIAALDCAVSEQHVQALESHARSLRDIANSLWATDVIERHVTYSNVGIQASAGDGYIEIEIPYELVTKSSLFRLLSKRIAVMKSLVPTIDAWHHLIKQVVDSYDSMPFEAPLRHAIIDITVLTPDQRKRDPDHFWFRPIQDGLVRNHVLYDDNTSNVDIAFHYGCDRCDPGVIIQVRPVSNLGRPPVRSKRLRSAFDS